ncbi:hypothetical protein [Marinobacter oulmenensis]|uniref:Uncharacterized protein n=1 Tax=Marinobacter oulmenensis TaxID=643747 RepID=A0A840UJM6_9GAMM|nr:hypothetical protein [Marinobacter oulmenensis]MBB5322911.1 hypothetical protein [Marinobacter oulmenensis]
MSELSINGEWPSLEGKVLQELICHEMYYQGKLEETANVTFIKVDGHWLRLYFDYDIIFWRAKYSVPQPYEMPEHNSYFKTRDVGAELELCGQIIKSVAAKGLKRGVEIEFKFDNGRSIFFQSIDDVSSYRT